MTSRSHFPHKRARLSGDIVAAKVERRSRLSGLGESGGFAKVAEGTRRTK
ncbi:hypothetical protein HBNXHr_0857 [Halorhabdus sp. BNX81]|nr:hypothetical protein HBNXHr_0857 [Halorhabdus sp. BNX81]